MVFICPHLRDPTEFLSQSQYRMVATSRGQRRQLIAVLNVWRYIEIYTLKFLCIFSERSHMAFGILIWLPCWGFILQQTFPAPFLPPSLLSASWLFSWIAKKKDKHFKQIKMYFDLWSSFFQVASGCSLLFLLSYREPMGNVVRQACWSFFLQDTISSFNLMLSLIKKCQHWGQIVVIPVFLKTEKQS